jgi:hypothetical protein
MLPEFSMYTLNTGLAVVVPVGLAGGESKSGLIFFFPLQPAKDRINDNAKGRENKNIFLINISINCFLKLKRAFHSLKIEFAKIIIFFL